jgi:hypothetical protein
MALAELIQLMALATDVITKKSELDKTYFEQFIQPIWEAFNEIHDDYKSSFRKYLDYIAQDDYNVDLLLETIRNDSIDTSDLRSELRKLIEYLPSANLKARKETLKSFVEAIREYFDIRHTGGDLTTNGLRNIRWMGYLTLSRNKDDSMRDSTAKLFDDLLRLIQAEFDKVADTYYSLKKEILA